MRKALIFIVTLLVTTAAFAQTATPPPATPPAPAPPQLRFPAPSPHASLMQTIGLVDMTISYSRPGVKGRQIWGALVPYDKVWRTGANEATKIAFTDDVMINGQRLPKGTYSLHTIPGQASWTLIFNGVADQWGSFSYDQAKDVLRVTAKPEKAPFSEWMTFEVPQLSADKATVVLRWENLAVPFTVETGSTQKALSAAGAAAATAQPTDWRTPYRAANFAFMADPNSADAQKWLDQSLKAAQNINNLWLKARMLQKRGQTADALRTGEQALAKATPQDAELAGEIRKEMETWRK